MKMNFDYSDINLIPKKCQVNSRSECKTDIKLGNRVFRSPVIPSNMECIIDVPLSIKLAESGYFYILHRFDINQIEFIKLMMSLNLITSISIGVNEESYKLIDDIKDQSLRLDYVTIDIAHGHSIKMKKMINKVKSTLPYTTIIAGNISTIEAAQDLQKWGADVIKVGIGPGSVCTTYTNTGFGSNGLQGSTVYKIALSSDLPIIADGGIRTPGDITKSIVLGAQMVMAGGIFSGLKDSPGSIIEMDGIQYKEFWGSASSYQSGKSSRIEGKKDLVRLKDRTLIEEMRFIEECLQSSISYAGGKDIYSLQSVNWEIKNY